MSMSCTVPELWRDITRNLQTVVYPTCVWRPCWNFAEILGISKLKSPWAILRHCLCLAILVQYWRVMDRQTYTRRAIMKLRNTH